MKNEWFALALVLISSGISAASQLLLKLSAVAKHKNLLLEYLNWQVLTSYGLLFATTLINMVAMRYLPFKVVTILGTSSYVFVALLSRLVFHERMGRKKAAGMLLILCGMVVFNL